MKAWKAVAAAILWVWAGSARAGENALDLFDAPVPYHAHFYVSSAQGAYRGTVWHSPGRERRDFDTEGGGQALLVLRREDSAYLLKPQGKWYVGIGLHAAAALAGGIDTLAVERRKVREETVGGMRTTRYRVKAVAANGDRFDGDAWLTRDGIVVKATGTLARRSHRAEHIETGLTDVVVGRVDSRMLTLPAGYFGMDLRQVPADKIQQAIAGIAPLLSGRGMR